MSTLNKNYLIGILGLLVLGGLVWFYYQRGVYPESPGGFLRTTRESQAPSTAPSATPSTPSKPSGGPTQVSPAISGRVVFALTDEMVALEGLQSLVATVNEVAVQHPTKGWVTVLKTPKQYDLVKMYRNSLSELLADVRLEPATYNQIRLVIGKVTVTEKGGTPQDVKLPSGDLRFVGRLVVQRDKTSSVLIDIQGDKSLFTTGSKKYVLLPVVRIDTKSEVNRVQTLGGSVEFIGGINDSSNTFGTDEKGNMKPGFLMDPSARLEIEGNEVKVLPRL